MSKVRVCPRCEGNIFLDWEMEDGAWYEYCLQCAYRHYITPPVKEKSEVAATRAGKRDEKGGKNDKSSK